MIRLLGGTSETAPLAAALAAAGHDVLVSAGQKSESFALLSMGFNFGLGAATGTADAARPRRFNTIYF